MRAYNFKWKSAQLIYCRIQLTLNCCRGMLFCYKILAVMWWWSVMGRDGSHSSTKSWQNLCFFLFHLPYVFHHILTCVRFSHPDSIYLMMMMTTATMMLTTF